MVIEMASAFLLVEHVIDHFTSPPDDLEPQIVIMGGWLLDAAKGKSTRRAAGRPAPRPHASASARCSCAPRWRRRSSPTCSTSSRCSTRSRATRRSATRSPTLPALPAPDPRRAHGAALRPRAAQAARRSARSMIAGMRRRRTGARRRHGLDRRGPVQPRLLPRALPARPRAGGAGDRAVLPALRASAHVQAGDRHARCALESSPIERLRRVAAARRARRRSKPRRAANGRHRRRAPTVDAELLGVFLDEAGEVLQTINDTAAGVPRRARATSTR